MEMRQRPRADHVKKVTPEQQQQELMRGLRQMPNGRWKVEVMVRGQRKSRSTDTLAEALQVKQALMAQLDSDDATALFLPPTKPSTKTSPKKDGAWTLKEGATQTVRHVWKHSKYPHTYQQSIAHLYDYFGEECLLAKITTEKVDGFREWCERVHKNKPATINRKVLILSRILRTAYERDKLPKLPKIPLVKLNNARIRYMTVEEEAATLKAFREHTSPETVDAFLVLLDTGFRLGELWTLEARNINIMTGTVSLWDGTTKNGLGRTVPMSSRVREILMRRSRQFPSGPLWPGACNRWFQHRWDKVRKLLGKQYDADWVTHMLRHTCCSRLVQSGANLFLVKEWMGHKSLEITNRYAHMSPQALHHIGQALEVWLERSRAADSTSATA